MLLMGRDSKRDAVPDPPTDDVLQMFQMGKHPGPVAVRGLLAVDLHHPYTSRWNKRTGDVVAAYIVREGGYPDDEETRSLIAKKFVYHIRTIKAHFNEQSGIPRNPVAAAASRQYNRTKQVRRHPSLPSFITLLMHSS